MRLLHWALAIAIGIAALSTLRFFGWHQPAGYAALAAVLVRLVWGGFGNRYARFGQFVRGPRPTLAYASSLLRRREPRYLGHNPLGAWMIVALMVCVVGLALTGWLYTTDWLWGNELVEQVHRALAWSLLPLVAGHVAGVILTTARHRENLVLSMVDGRKRAAENGDVA